MATDCQGLEKDAERNVCVCIRRFIMISHAFYTVVVKLASFKSIETKGSPVLTCDADENIVGINYVNWADVKKEVKELETKGLEDGKDFAIFHAADGNFKNKDYEVVEYPWVSLDTESENLVYNNAV